MPTNINISTFPGMWIACTEKNHHSQARKEGGHTFAASITDRARRHELLSCDWRGIAFDIGQKTSKRGAALQLRLVGARREENATRRTSHASNTYLLMMFMCF